MKIQRLILCLAPLALVGCGTTEVMKNIDETYSVSAQYGSANGSWDRASKDANEKALIYCEGMGKKIELIDERRDGIWGISPQRAEVKFRCVGFEGSQNKNTPKVDLETRLQNLKDLYKKGLITKDQYDKQVEKSVAQ